MSEYTRWQQLNESLGFPLGVKTAASLGITGGFTGFEEAKKCKKKKMNGMEVPAEEEEEEEEEDIDIEEKPGLGKPSLGKKKPKICTVGDKDDEDEDIGDEDVEIGAEEEEEEEGPMGKGPMGKGPMGKSPMFCRKGMKSGQKKKAKKSMKEDIFASYRGTEFEETPEVGSEEYRQEFFRSLADHFSDPDKKHGSGVDLGEEVIFEPRDDTTPLAQTPVPGQPGSSPYTRIGEMPSAPPIKSDWEEQWEEVPMAEEFIQQTGLGDSFDEFKKKRDEQLLVEKRGKKKVKKTDTDDEKKGKRKKHLIGALAAGAALGSIAKKVL